MDVALDRVLPLTAVRRDDAALVGDKAAALGELMAAGVDAPSGFVVSVAGFRHFVRAAGLQPAIDQALLPLHGSGARGQVPIVVIEHASRQIQAAIQAASIPEGLAGGVRAAYIDLCRDVPGSTGTNVAVAIRPSVTAASQREAKGTASQATYLHVRGLDALLERLKASWAASYAPRALAAGVADVGPTNPLPAVIVQRMVDSDSSGVCLPLDPVSGDASRIVVEATWGLGESLRSGRVRPDRFVVDRTSLAILERHIAHKAIECVPRPDRGLTLEQAVHPSRQSAPSMTDEEVSRVAQTALHVEQRLGSPHRIEFAIEFVRHMRRIRVVGTHAATTGSPQGLVER